jgi:hypothetical protein
MFVILEAIVTTVDQQGNVNLAPMGPICLGDISSFVDTNLDSRSSWHSSCDNSANQSEGSSTISGNDRHVATCSEGTGRTAPRVRPDETDGGQEASKSCPELGFVLKPFKTSRTYANLLENPFATIHITDNALLFAETAVSNLSLETKRSLVYQLKETSWWPLKDCHRWFAVEVSEIHQDPQRVSMDCRVMYSRTVRPFFGFNRAKHAVIEAAILATRTQFLRKQDVLAELERLQPLVDKTGGSDECSGFELLKTTIHEQYARH